MHTIVQSSKDSTIEYGIRSLHSTKLAISADNGVALGQIVRPRPVDLSVSHALRRSSKSGIRPASRTIELTP